MKLTSMKLAKKKKGDEPGVPQTSESEQPEYPWGLRITLEKEQVEKLGGMKGAKIGEEVGIKAVGKITSLSETENQKGPDRRTIEIQITGLDISFDTDFERGFDEASKKE